MGEDVHKQTDGAFAGENSVQPENTYFAGNSYQQQVRSSTNAPFAQESTNMAKDGVFIGDDVRKKTNGLFAGDNYGK